MKRSLSSGNTARGSNVQEELKGLKEAFARNRMYTDSLPVTRSKREDLLEYMNSFGDTLHLHNISIPYGFGWGRETPIYESEFGRLRTLYNKRYKEDKDPRIQNAREERNERLKRRAYTDLRHRFQKISLEEPQLTTNSFEPVMLGRRSNSVTEGLAADVNGMSRDDMIETLVAMRLGVPVPRRREPPRFTTIPVVKTGDI